MKSNFLDLLLCPGCGNHPMHAEAFDMFSGEEILDGVLICNSCQSWYPIQGCLLELLAGPLSYNDDRLSFYHRFSDKLEFLGLRPPSDIVQNRSAFADQFKQQSHFDWYARNPDQTYAAYENTPFWKAADEIAFGEWRKEIALQRYLLDVGCAQGRSGFKLMDLELNILGFDISKAMVAQAIQRYHANRYAASAFFFVADGSRFPIVGSSIDYLLIYGVLHHLPDPEATCREVSRVLKSGGVYFGSENNDSGFRFVFDAIQRLFPLWHEEAGAEPLVSKEKLVRWFKGTTVEIKSKTSVFLPPHLINLLGDRFSLDILRTSDRLGSSIPFMRDHGGLILIRGQKT